MNRKHKMTIGVTLPPSPAVGRFVNLVRHPDERLVVEASDPIMGLSGSLVVDNDDMISLIFVGGSTGWQFNLGGGSHGSFGGSAQVHASASAGDGAEGAAGSAGGIPQGP
jgi:hypothetical protein